MITDFDVTEDTLEFHYKLEDVIISNGRTLSNGHLTWSPGSYQNAEGEITVVRIDLSSTFLSSNISDIDGYTGGLITFVEII